jgi:hypothetical protein
MCTLPPYIVVVLVVSRGALPKSGQHTRVRERLTAVSRVRPDDGVDKEVRYGLKPLIRLRLAWTLNILQRSM